MKEAHLRDFIAVVESGSLRAAALRLGISQSAVSKNLTALERSFGVPLLLRTAHGAAPTEAGLLLLQRARAVERELSKATEEIQALIGGGLGPVTVGLSPTPEALLMAPALLAFRKRHPDTIVTLMGGPPTATLRVLREGRIDFAISPQAPSAMTVDLHWERLLSSDLAIVARRDHPRAAARDVGELQGTEWILSDQAENKNGVTQLFHGAGLADPKIAVRRYSLSALLFLLMQTDWLSLSAILNMQPFMDAGMLTRIPVRIELPPLVIGMYTTRARPLTRPAQELANEFRKAARSFRR